MQIQKYSTNLDYNRIQKMVFLIFEPGATRWLAQMIPLSNGGTPQTKKIFSWRKWTTGSANTVKQSGISPFNALYKLFTIFKHSSLPLGLLLFIFSVYQRSPCLDNWHFVTIKIFVTFRQRVPTTWLVYPGHKPCN